MQITVNGKQVKTIGPYATYWELKRLAMPDDENGRPTIQYTGIRSGVMLPGDTVELHPSMMFDVVHTDNA